MKIAVIGAGISGLSAAWHLAGQHDVTLFEANHYLGGHTNTIDVTVAGVTHPVDTGFLVFNHRTYPNLTRFFDELGVATAPSEMSFSVAIDGAGRGGRALEWAGTNLAAVFAQAGNLARPAFLRMLADIVRFNDQTTDLARTGLAEQLNLSVGDFLATNRYSDALRDWYLLPMIGAIWSCPTATMLDFPIATLIRFCHNHGLLQVSNRPQWYTVSGGGREYVKAMRKRLPQVHMASSVHTLGVLPNNAGVRVTTEAGAERFDAAVVATHSDQALALLEQPSVAERQVLGAIGYQPNRAVVHTDTALLPRARRAWAAWNYQSRGAGLAEPGMAVTYWLNALQPLPFDQPVLVSLNPLQEPDPNTVLSEIEYAHPVFDASAISAQRRLSDIQGQHGIWYAGAWTGYGFHEDGFVSGLRAARDIQAWARDRASQESMQQAA